MSDWSEAEYERVKQHIRENEVVGGQTMDEKGWTSYANELVEDGAVVYDPQYDFYEWIVEDDCSPECECRADAQYVDGEGNPLGAPDGFEDEYFPDESHDTFVLEDAIETVYSRPEQHGEPEDSFATIAGFWNEYLHAGGIDDPNITPDDVAMMMALLKVARSAEGVYDEDNPRDIAGYVENYARLNDGDSE